MKRLSMFAAACAIAMLAAQAQAQNLLIDGSFTLATDGGTASNSPWTLTFNNPDPNNPTDTSAKFQDAFGNAENGIMGDPDAAGTGLQFRSFLGERGGMTGGNFLKADADVTQNVIAPLSSDYRLDFRAAREADHLSDVLEVVISSSGTGGATTIDLLSAAIPDGNIGGALSPNQGGTPFTIFLNGVTAGDTLTVTGRMVGGVDNVGGGGQSAFLDKFVLTAIPEPSSLALLSLGFVGFLGRRRKA